MSKSWVVVKREFVEFVRKKTFIVATILGPLAMIAFFGAQFFFLTQGGGGEHSVVVLDASERDLGEQVVAMITAPRPTDGMRKPATFHAEAQPVGADEAPAARAELRERVASEDVGGYLYLPPAILTGSPAVYEGADAMNSAVIGELRAAIQHVVQGTRLADAGIEPSSVGAALAAVRLEAAKIGADGSQGSQGATEGAMFVGMAMGFAIYLMVLLYGASVMNGVVEEKQDRVVELVISSIHAEDLMLGKVLGIGAAGLLQMTIWVAAAALIVVNGPTVVGVLGASDAVVQQLSLNPILPTLPLSAILVFLAFFAGAFFLYATVYSILGAVATTAQEAQQLVFPAILPLILGFFMMFSALENPDSTIAVVGGLIPFTSPLVTPVRVVLAGIDPTMLAASVALLFGTAYLMIWIGGKIYRIGIFATGKRASFGEVVRWIRAA